MRLNPGMQISLGALGTTLSLTLQQWVGLACGCATLVLLLCQIVGWFRQQKREKIDYERKEKAYLAGQLGLGDVGNR